MRLYLIGMPGAGKTTLGRGLAAAYQVPFFDLDAEIVRQEGRSVADIFTTEGEPCFRALEARLMRKIIAEQPALVLATGGGTPCFHDNLEVLLDTGLTLYLAVEVKELVARLRHSAAKRPLLATMPDPEALAVRLHETFAARQRFYERAPLRCAPPACTVEGVRRLVERYLASA